MAKHFAFEDAPFETNSKIYLHQLIVISRVYKKVKKTFKMY